ncbi:hypothetical protein GWO43_30520 [candidate division KSB1 bacterium]|nr:hypothetical protein [candidate division KSB1 bacterium]NIR72929.1 hypothetical protein [candidate division KSB1 bacterium]NIS28228.1 hypothetical protein [candidate division KSB1 bacterium]NIT75117.1 hypothetical protein [candidate division KSB1 bacterium]NIU28905.1 hypothetical protein [candidate division KSB1 bacterium]
MVNPAGIHERADPAVRKIEGLSPINRTSAGVSPPELLEIKENGLRFFVDIFHGQKTGFYLNQCDNRKTVAEYATAKNVLDGFSYSGGFGVHALSAGAHSVTSVDSSAACLELFGKNYELNNFLIPGDSTIKGDVFQLLRMFREQNRNFDMVILDPAKFAHGAPGEPQSLHLL